MFPNLILHNAKLTTLDRENPAATAVSIRDGAYVNRSADREVLASVGPDTQIIDLKGRSVLPGLTVNHTHIVRGGLNFNLELRRGGATSLSDAETAGENHPKPQWVQLIGGFSDAQVDEKRFPTLAEINAIAPRLPVFLLHLYDRSPLNGETLRVVGYTKDTPNLPGRRESARRGARSHGPVTGASQRRDSLRHPRLWIETSLRLPRQFDLPFHVRA